MIKSTFLARLFFLFVAGTVSAQTEVPERQSEFTATTENGGLRFVPQNPPLGQVAGAPAAFYTHYWEFGDGGFSFEEKPWRAYEKPGTYNALLSSTAHYDDDKKPPKKMFKQVLASAGAPGRPGMGDVFPDEDKTIAVKTHRQPAAGEELICVVSYRNKSSYTTDGRLHLFFNEKKFPTTHFAFLEARTHYNEQSEAPYSQVEPSTIPYWSAIEAGFSATGASSPPEYTVFLPSANDLIQNARKAYRDETVWRFASLAPGEKRNLFVSLQGTANMLRDTSAFIHLLGVLAPFDPAIAPDSFTVEIEIVSSHDPNAIAVSDNRVGYRGITGKKLDYQVRFQNNGEGPAKKVEVTISMPKGLNLGRMRPLDWYPKCPVCLPSRPPGSCLDTATTDAGLVFTFRDIYLPGSRQKGLTDYDSTKGFVRYRIEADEDMPKLPFQSQAAIVFDKNPPVLTNFSKTSFKTGISPGLKVGYGFAPDSLGDGYFFLGASLSPYKSWRLYPQVELLTGLKGRTALPEFLTIIPADTTKLMGDIDTLTSQEILRTGNRGFVSVEVPLLLRKNFTNFFGVGIGGSARVFFNNGEDRTRVTTIGTPYRLTDIGGFIHYEKFGTPTTTVEETVQDVSDTSIRFAVFADLTLGSVRAGPNLGIRAGSLLGERAQAFVQVALEYKF
ncbi:MAG: hypothetical protein ABMA02_14555 [Saprospiraceae bacterium]